MTGGWSLTLTKATPVCNTDCAGAPRISTTTTFACNSANTIATITVSNSGTAANNVVLTTAKIGASATHRYHKTSATLRHGRFGRHHGYLQQCPSGSQTVTVGGTFTGGTYNSIEYQYPAARSLVVPSQPTNSAASSLATEYYSPDRTLNRR